MTRPDDTVGVQFVNPASQVQTTEATTTPTVSPTTVPPASAVASKSTTHKAAVRTKEGTVSEPKVESSTTPPAPDDPIRQTAPPPIPGNGPQLSGEATPPSGTK